jgi:hypothetical protein
MAHSGSNQPRWKRYRGQQTKDGSLIWTNVSGPTHEPTGHIWLLNAALVIILWHFVGFYALWAAAEWLFKAWLLWLLLAQMRRWIKRHRSLWQ